MVLGAERGERERGGGVACLASSQLTAQLDIGEHCEPPHPPSQRVTLGLFPQ